MWGEGKFPAKETVRSKAQTLMPKRGLIPNYL
jgi:hypothetical protein